MCMGVFVCVFWCVCVEKKGGVSMHGEQETL
jgi:hypothetical protein